MKGIILFQSKYGATKKYADWISEATGFECVETKKANIQHPNGITQKDNKNTR